MACKQCVANKARSLKRRQELHQQRLDRLTKACDHGDQMSCITLQRMLDAENYRQNNRFRSEFHQRRNSPDQT